MLRQDSFFGTLLLLLSLCSLSYCGQMVYQPPLPDPWIWVYTELGTGESDSLTFLGCTFIDIGGSHWGGVIQVIVAHCHLIDTVFHRCHAGKGGALEATTSNLTHFRCCASECWATEEQAGHFLAFGNMPVVVGDELSVTGDQTAVFKCGDPDATSGPGDGTIIAYSGEGTVSNLNFTSCFVWGDGAAYFERSLSPSLLFTHIVVVRCQGNTVFTKGGGVTTIQYCQFYENERGSDSAPSDSSGVIDFGSHAIDCVLNVESCAFLGNGLPDFSARTGLHYALQRLSNCVFSGDSLPNCEEIVGVVTGQAFVPSATPGAVSGYCPSEIFRTSAEAISVSTSSFTS
jgi:hypothetical protein